MERKVEINLLELPVITFPEEDMFVSEVPIFNIASQGKTVEESIKNLKEAVELYFEDEDVKKLIKDKFPFPNAVLTTTMTFDVKSKEVVRIPVSM